MKRIYLMIGNILLFILQTFLLIFNKTDFGFIFNSSIPFVVIIFFYPIIIKKKDITEFLIFYGIYLAENLIFIIAKLCYKLDLYEIKYVPSKVIIPLVVLFIYKKCIKKDKNKIIDD